MNLFHWDYETTSACDISLGSARYACDPTTRILMFAASVDDDSPVLWDFLNPDSEESRHAVSIFNTARDQGLPAYAHNVMFEHFVSRYRLLTDVGIQPFAIEQLRCTAAMARRAAIPVSLAKCAEFLKLGIDKDARGKALIGIFSDQNKQVLIRNGKESRKTHSPILENPIPWNWTMTVAGETLTVAEAWQQFKDYCRQDVRVEQRVHKALAKFEILGDELQGFQFDLRMNDLGAPVNVEALKHAAVILEYHREALEKEFSGFTGLMPTQTAKVLEWLRGEGYPGDNLQAETMEKWLGSSFLTASGARALDIRSQLSFAAVKKVGAMLDTVCPDGRMRGLFTWHGAQRTGRWTSQGPQLQNAKKPTIKDADDAYLHIRQGFDPEAFEILHGNPYEAVASCIRNFMQMPVGSMLDADFAAIELKLAGILADQHSMTDAFREGRDLYKELASVIFGIPVDEITKDQRFVGKTAFLACIEEGQLVLTNEGLIPIEEVKCCHLLWDGVEWVRHEGVIYKGVRDTIEYQGLRATPDHNVFTLGGEGRERKIHFGTAKQTNRKIIESGNGRQEIRIVDHSIGRNPAEGGRACVCPRTMPMRVTQGGLSAKSGKGENVRMQIVQNAAKELPALVEVADHITTGSLHQSSESRLGPLWWPRNPVSVRVNFKSLRVGDGELGFGEGIVFGPNRQRWSLRTGELTVGYPVAARVQPGLRHFTGEFQSGRMAVCHRCSKEENGSRNEPGSDYRIGASCGQREAETLEGHPRKARVYDILNAGPRHRFTVSGLLVSNCIYQVGAKTFHDTCAKWGKPIPKELAIKAVNTFREVNDKFPPLWRKYESAAVAAIESPEKWFVASPYVKFARTLRPPFDRLIMRLPSGRDIIHPYPSVERKVKSHRDFETGEVREWETNDITFYGQMKGTAQWGRVGTYAGSLYQTSVQATARDIMVNGCLTAEREGFRIFALIHDQALAEEGDPELFVKALCTLPPWLPADTPITAEGGLAPYYRKD